MLQSLNQPLWHFGFSGLWCSHLDGRELVQPWPKLGHYHHGACGCRFRRRLRHRVIKTNVAPKNGEGAYRYLPAIMSWRGTVTDATPGP
jgi:hypothetical protein